MFNWLILFLVYLPFQIALNIGADLASSRLIIILFFSIWLAVRYLREQLKIKKFFNFSGFCLILFLSLSVFSLARAVNIIWGLRKLIYFLSVFPLYFLVADLAENFNQVKKIFRALAWGGLAVALVGLSQFAAQFIFGLEKVYAFWANWVVYFFSGFNYGSLILVYPSWLVNLNGATVMRAFSVFSDPHIFSLYLGMILPLMAAVCPDSWAGLGMVGLVYFALLFSFARGAYVAVIVSLFLVAFLFWRRGQRKKRAVFILLFLLVIFLPVSPISQRFYSSFDASEGSNAGRLEMWRQAGLFGLKNPLFGLGLGNYALLIDSQFDYRNPATAHNLYLDFFSELGALALAVWLVLIFGTAGRLFVKLKSANQEEQCLIIGLLGSLVYFSVHSFFETSVYSSPVLAVLMVILAVSAAICEKRSI